MELYCVDILSISNQVALFCARQDIASYTDDLNSSKVNADTVMEVEVDNIYVAMYVLTGFNW